jgi:hypothetical protein
MKSESFFRPAAVCTPVIPDARTLGPYVRACSGSLESLQFGAAFLAEGPQRI